MDERLKGSLTFGLSLVILENEVGNDDASSIFSDKNN